MAQLFNHTQNLLLSENLTVAESLWARTKGLLGKKDLHENEMLWILRCNSIHTFFMKFPIDCVFLDKQMLVCSIHSHIKPWRLILPVLKARSVIEMKAHTAKRLNLRLGDQLHVGH